MNVFTTAVIADGKISEQGVLAGNLVLRGGGDPDFSARIVPYQPKNEFAADRLKPVKALVDQIVAAGVKKIDGDIVGDDSRYGWQPYGVGWSVDDGDYGYGAPVSALTLNDIATAQLRLKDFGYYSGPVDGVLGPITVAALRAYQRDQRLTVTGRLDPPTARVLITDASPAPAADVQRAQRQLKERGYYSGAIDGVMGPATQAALRAYQRDRGLSVTGRLDSQTVQTL